MAGGENFILVQFCLQGVLWFWNYVSDILLHLSLPSIFTTFYQRVLKATSVNLFKALGDYFCIQIYTIILLRLLNITVFYTKTQFNSMANNKMYGIAINPRKHKTTNKGHTLSPIPMKPYLVNKKTKRNSLLLPRTIEDVSCSIVLLVPGIKYILQS